jgi:hypothetical protein
MDTRSATPVPFTIGALIIGFFLILPQLSSATGVFEQTDSSTLGDMASLHSGLPTQKLGKGHTGPAGSVAYRVHGGSDLAANIGGGLGEVELYACPSASYSGCTQVADSGFTPQIISQTGDNADVLVDFSARGYSFDPELYYFFRWINFGDMALYGSASDTFAGGEAGWLSDVNFGADSAIADVAFRMCDTSTCDLTVVPPPPPADTQAPVLAEVSPIPVGTVTTPSYAFTSTEAGAITYGGACSSAATTASTGTNTITFDALIPDTYNSCTITVTDTAGNAGVLAVTPFTIITYVPPVLSPTTKDQCKDDGWRDFTNPTFKNQGQCVSYVQGTLTTK